VWAMDASTAMVERTRDRVRSLTKPDEMRVQRGRMDDLSEFADGWFDLVVALGVYHNASSRAEWERAIAESARVLKPDGRLLVNSFTPGVDLTGKGVHAVAGEPDVFEGLPDGRAVLVEAPALDAAVTQHGLIPEVPSETVRVVTDNGRRVSVNALYVKPDVATLRRG
ncbi:MAG TPA: class I SAM-dependent methyltransferase, partial [Longimicrobiales bacterium]|nr:class I SAM-dependent methyltransferase [Longimicrobiales bacterium]